ncbi:MAG: hypothetical protein M1812_001123 [Candelaria pacifica]|nr:MAG: hypothetical protein M1812_001123 [Candelaria pacifica]
MPLTASPHSTTSLSTISSTSSGSSSNNPSISESILPTLPEPAVPKRVHARNRHAHISAPPDFGYHYNASPLIESSHDNSRRKHISLPNDPANAIEQLSPTPFQTEDLPLASSAGGGNHKGDKAGHGSRKFDFSYRNVYITPGAANGIGRARVGNGSGTPAGNCVLM